MLTHAHTFSMINYRCRENTNVRMYDRIGVIAKHLIISTVCRCRRRRCRCHCPNENGIDYVKQRNYQWQQQQHRISHSLTQYVSTRDGFDFIEM